MPNDQTIAVELTRAEAEEILRAAEVDFPHRNRKGLRGFQLAAYTLGLGKLRAALDQPETDPPSRSDAGSVPDQTPEPQECRQCGQHDEVCVHSKAVLGCPGCLARLKRQAARALLEPQPPQGAERERDEWRARCKREKKLRKKADRRARRWKGYHAQQVRRVRQIADELKRTRLSYGDRWKLRWVAQKIEEELGGMSAQLCRDDARLLRSIADRQEGE